MTDEDHRSVADGVLDGVFELQGLKARVPTSLDGGLDWTDSGPRGDSEWIRFLNRHDFLRSLLRAWQQTGDERYRTAIGSHLSDWVRSVPRPLLPTLKGTWRSLEAARRSTLPWLEVFFCRTPRPALDPETRILLLGSLVDHAQVLRYWHGRRGNHLFTELVALAVLATAWPEFKRAADWLEYAASRACRVVSAQTYPDGAHTELSNHYHRVILLEAERLAAVLSLTGREAQLRPVRERLIAMWDYFAGVSRPDGYGPLNNDGDLEPNGWYVADAGKRLNKPEWLYVATGGAEGSAPADNSASRFFPWAGQAVMRSGWEVNAHWARFDLGPHGTNHQHHDQLSIELFAGGRPILVDPGRYTYQRGRAREYFRGPAGHNVIRVDGKGSAPPPNRVSAPLEVKAVCERDYDFFCGRARFLGRPLTGRPGCIWRRAVFYLREKYWIVVDHLATNGPAEITASWLFHPHCTVAAEPDCVYTEGQEGSNLAIVPTTPSQWLLEICKGQTEPEMRGWYSECYNRLEACTQVECHTSIRGPTAFGWILFPSSTKLVRPRAATPTAVLSNEGLTVSIAITLPQGAGEDRVVMDLGDAREIELGSDMRVEGPCGVLHRGPEGSRLIGRTVAPESALSE